MKYSISISYPKEVVLVLLDLSAAYGTIDHGMLLARLEQRYGVAGTAL